MPCFDDHVFDFFGECVWDVGCNWVGDGDGEGSQVGLGDMEGKEGGVVEVEEVEGKV